MLAVKRRRERSDLARHNWYGYTPAAKAVSSRSPFPGFSARLLVISRSHRRLAPRLACRPEAVAREVRRSLGARISGAGILKGGILAVAAVLAGGGCVERRLTVYTNPPGAQLFVDDYEIGTTPVSTDFVYYGPRKIRLVKDGYETAVIMQPIPTPWYEYFPADFITENLVPGHIRDERKVTYQLQPTVQVPTDQLVGRGEALRQNARIGAAANAQVRVTPAAGAAPITTLPGPETIPPGGAVPPNTLPPNTFPPNTLPPPGALPAPNMQPAPSALPPNAYQGAPAYQPPGGYQLPPAYQAPAQSYPSPGFTTPPQPSR